jgi:hypothetical protein
MHSSTQIKKSWTWVQFLYINHDPYDSTTHALYDTKCIIHNDKLNIRSLINEFAPHSCIMCVYAAQPSSFVGPYVVCSLSEYVYCLKLHFYAVVNAVDVLVTTY